MCNRYWEGSPPVINRQGRPLMNPGACLHGGYREHICSVSVPSVSGQTHPKGGEDGRVVLLHLASFPVETYCLYAEYGPLRSPSTTTTFSSCLSSSLLLLLKFKQTASFLLSSGCWQDLSQISFRLNTFFLFLFKFLLFSFCSPTDDWESN